MANRAFGAIKTFGVSTWAATQRVSSTIPSGGTGSVDHAPSGGVAPSDDVAPAGEVAPSSDMAAASSSDVAASSDRATTSSSVVASGDVASSSRPRFSTAIRDAEATVADLRLDPDKPGGN
jgi:hypothetical protein